MNGIFTLIKSMLSAMVIVFICGFVYYSNADAQVVNPGQPTTAGIGLTKSGTSLNVIYGTGPNTTTMGNDIRLPTSNGSAGDVLTSNGAGVAPTYQPGGGGGAVTSVFTQTGAVPNLSGDVSTSGSSVTTLATVPTSKGGTGLTTAGTDGNVLTASGGVWTSTAPVTGGGTVDFGTMFQVPYYTADGTTVAGWPYLSVADDSGVGAIYVGNPGSAAGGKLAFQSANGIVSISPSPSSTNAGFILPIDEGASGLALLSNGAGSPMVFDVLGVSAGGTGAITLDDNGVLYGNGTSAVGVTTVGNSGQVLTSNGTGAAPTFQNAPGGGLSLIGTYHPANATSYCIDFSNEFSSTYDNYKIILNDVASVSSTDTYKFSPGYSGSISNTGGDLSGTRSVASSGTQTGIASVASVWDLMPGISTSHSINGTIEITGANNANGYGYSGFAQIAYFDNPTNYSRFNLTYNGANVLTGGAICRATQTGSVYLKTTSTVKVYGYNN